MKYLDLDPAQQPKIFDVEAEYMHLGLSTDVKQGTRSLSPPVDPAVDP